MSEVNLGWPPMIIVFSAALIAAGTDLWKFRVYNALTFPLVIAGLGYHAFVPGGMGFGYSAMGMAFGFSVLIVPHLLGLMGAGDVKLLAGIGAWLGTLGTAYVFAGTAFVAGAVSLLLILYRGEFSDSWATTKTILYRFLVAPTQVDKDDFVSALANGTDRRLRVIPFAATIPPGLVLTFLYLMS